jgi:hypothetical protein
MFQHDTLHQPVLGHVGEARSDRVLHRGDTPLHPLDDDPPRVGRADTEQRQRQLGPSRADQPGDAQNLAFVEVKGNASEVVAFGEVTHL